MRQSSHVAIELVSKRNVGLSNPARTEEAYLTIFSQAHQLSRGRMKATSILPKIRRLAETHGKSCLVDAHIRQRKWSKEQSRTRQSRQLFIADAGVMFN